MFLGFEEGCSEHAHITNNTTTPFDSLSTSLLGWHCANSSMKLEILREMSWCICRRANLVRCSVPMDDFMVVFSHFTALNNHSAEQLVTGSVHKILRSACMLGNIVEAWIVASWPGAIDTVRFLSYSGLKRERRRTNFCQESNPGKYDWKSSALALSYNSQTKAGLPLPL